MEQTLPRHLTHHDALSEAQTAYLSGVTGRHQCDAHAAIVRAMLVQQVDGYRDEPGDWQAAARRLLASATRPDSLLASDTVKGATAAMQAALAGYRPAKALNVLVLLQTRRMEAARRAALACVKTADEFFSATSNAA